ncbi:hypothetical protein BV20DRAFT_1057236 [Pilatotrama ljubarskyi]|nr:hypothetical protein BV20DRAFT_1057236 [Pilatotrama ljubarskyi]
MLVDIKIHLFMMENNILKRYFQLYARHLAFVMWLRSVINAVICAHNVPAYVNNVTASITVFLSAVVGYIPPKVL